MSQFVNINKCYSFNFTATATLQELVPFICSEVLLYNKSSTELKIFDVDPGTPNREFVLGAGQSIVMRGLTNTANLSVQTVSGTGTVYGRSAYYSNLNQQ
jgi:hypothetical protein